MLDDESRGLDSAICATAVGGSFDFGGVRMLRRVSSESGLVPSAILRRPISSASSQEAASAPTSTNWPLLL